MRSMYMKYTVLQFLYLRLHKESGLFGIISIDRGQSFMHQQALGKEVLQDLKVILHSQDLRCRNMFKIQRCSYKLTFMSGTLLYLYINVGDIIVYIYSYLS